MEKIKKYKIHFVFPRTPLGKFRPYSIMVLCKGILNSLSMSFITYIIVVTINQKYF